MEWPRYSALSVGTSILSLLGGVCHSSTYLLVLDIVITFLYILIVFCKWKILCYFIL